MPSTLIAGTPSPKRCGDFKMNTSSPRRTNLHGAASISGVPRFSLNCSTRHRRRRVPRLSLTYSPFSVQAHSGGAYDGSRSCTVKRLVRKLTSSHSQSPSARTRAPWQRCLRASNAQTTLGPHARTFLSSSATVALAYSVSNGLFSSVPRSSPTSTSGRSRWASGAARSPSTGLRD